MTFPDLDSNGIPDAFENRPSIIEVLNESEAVELTAQRNRAVVEIEIQPRWPKKGEIFIADGRFFMASRDLQYFVLVVRRVIAGDVMAADFR